MADKKIEVASFELENLEELARNTADIKQNIDQLAESNRELKKAGKGASEEFVRNDSDLKALRKAYNANIKVMAEATEQTADLAARSKLLDVALTQEVKSIDQARASNKLLNKLRNSANLATEEGRKEVEKLNDALNRNNQFIRENVDEYAQQKINIGNYKDSVKEALNELNPFNGGLLATVQRAKEAGGATALLTGTFQILKTAIVDATTAALRFIATPIGAFLTVLAGIGLIAKEVFDYNTNIREAAILTEQLTNTTGELADTLRNRNQSIVNTFGNDFKENLIAARNLVQAFGVTYEEAFDLIENGLLRGGSANDEFLDSIREYPKFFAAAGFSAEEFLAVLQSAADSGIYNDKLQDAIKEFSLAINEQTKTARDALENAFGAEFTNELFGNLNSGAITVKEALATISAEASTASLNAQQQAQLTADLFKGAGEDAGGALLVFEAVNAALNEEAVALTELEAQIARQLELQNELAIAKDAALKSDEVIALQQEFANFGTWLETRFYEILGGVGSVFTDITDQAIAGILSYIGTAQQLPSIFKDVFDNIFSGQGVISSVQQGVAAINETAQGIYTQAIEDRRAARDAQVEIAKQEEEGLVEVERQKQERLTTLQIEAARKKEELLAKQREKELEQEQAQLDKLHEKVQAELEKRNEAQIKAIQTFEDRRRQLENDIALRKEQDDQARQLLRAEQQYEKDILALEQITLTEQQKTELLILLEENKQLAVQEIRDKYNELALSKKQKANEAEFKMEQQSAQAIAGVQRQLTTILSGLLGDSVGAKVASIALEAAIEAGKVGIASKASSAINIAQATAALPPPLNVPFIAQAGVQNAVTQAAAARSISGILSSAALKGLGSFVGKFEHGGFIGGPRHSSGGVFLNAEGGEFMFSRRAVNMWGRLLPAMNAAAGGNSGPNTSGYFADGGLVARSISNQLGVDPEAIKQAVIESVGSIRVVNVAQDTLDVINDNAKIVENATI